MISREGLSTFIQTRETGLPAVSWSDSGHAYSISYCLGEFSNVTPKRLVQEMKAGTIFPLIIKQGSFSSEGQTVTLSLPQVHRLKFLPFSENEVRVKQITEDGILLEALPKHVFQGTVLHRIKKCGHKLFYTLEGKGVPDESPLSRLANAAFIKLHLWEFFIKTNVIDAVKTLEARLEAEKGTI